MNININLNCNKKNKDNKDNKDNILALLEDEINSISISINELVESIDVKKTHIKKFKSTDDSNNIFSDSFNKLYKDINNHELQLTFLREDLKAFKRVKKYYK